MKDFRKLRQKVEACLDNDGTIRRQHWDTVWAEFCQSGDSVLPEMFLMLVEEVNQMKSALESGRVERVRLENQHRESLATIRLAIDHLIKAQRSIDGGSAGLLKAQANFLGEIRRAINSVDTEALTTDLGEKFERGVGERISAFERYLETSFNKWEFEFNRFHRRIRVVEMIQMGRWFTLLRAMALITTIAVGGFILGQRSGRPSMIQLTDEDVQILTLLRAEHVEFKEVEGMEVLVFPEAKARNNKSGNAIMILNPEDEGSGSPGNP